MVGERGGGEGGAGGRGGVDREVPRAAEQTAAARRAVAVTEEAAAPQAGREVVKAAVEKAAEGMAAAVTEAGTAVVVMVAVERAEEV